MKLSEFFASGIMHKKAILKKRIKLSTGISRSKGTVVDIFKEYDTGEFHAENGDWACRVKSDEIEFIDGP